MQLKDAASNFGRVGFLLPLTLIFLLAADSAYACPGNTSRVSYRTRSINNRTVSHMPTTVITYRAPASYRRCGANLYDTRGARYVAVRSNGTRHVAIRGSGARYVAVRSDDDFSLGRKRYGAVYDVDYGTAARRYSVVNRNPVYVANGTRYVAVRSHTPRTRYIAVRNVDFDDDDEPGYVAVRRVVPRTRYVAVRNIDIDDDEPRYVAVRRHVSYDPGVRYVAVRRHPAVRYVTVNRDNGYYDTGRTKYVNIDSGCTRAVALRSCLDQIETKSMRHVVLRNDDGYSARTKHVVLRDEIDDDDTYIVQREIDDDDDEYIAVANDTPKYIEYRDATYSNGNGRTYIAANDFDNTCLRNVAVRTCRPDVVSARTMAYEVSDDDDWDDRAFNRDDDATYVAVDDMDDACLPRRVVGTSPAIVAMRAVNYVPAEYVVEDASPLRSQTTYVETSDAAVPWPRYVALDEDRVFDDLDPTWVAEVEDTCLRQAAHCNLVDEVAAGTVNFVPVDDVGELATVSYLRVDDGDVETVSYMPVDNMNVRTVSYEPVDDDIDVSRVRYVPVDDDIDVQTVSYVPVSDRNFRTVRNVPVDDVDEVETAYIAADACPMSVSYVDAEPIYVRDASTVIVEEIDDELVADLRGTQAIAGRFGYRDGFEDGQEAALEGDLYHPENSGDFKKATEGYEDEFGDKDVYKDSYRSSYLAGYRAGFESGSSV